jgi:hypothetical protein
MNLFDDLVFNFLKALETNKVEYLLVGGFAVNTYANPRATGDLDLWIKDTKNNRLHLIAAFRDVGIDSLEPLADIQLIAGFSEILLDKGFYVDLMTDLKHFKQIDFDTCFAIALDFKINDIVVKVLHKNDLIQEKKATGRYKDLDDLEHLEK